MRCEKTWMNKIIYFIFWIKTNHKSTWVYPSQPAGMKSILCTLFCSSSHDRGWDWENKHSAQLSRSKTIIHILLWFMQIMLLLLKNIFVLDWGWDRWLWMTILNLSWWFFSQGDEEKGGSFSQLLLCITSACKRDLFSSGDLLLDIICVHFCKNVLSIILDSNLAMKSVPTQLNWYRTTRCALITQSILLCMLMSKSNYGF